MFHSGITLGWKTPYHLLPTTTRVCYSDIIIMINVLYIYVFIYIQGFLPYLAYRLPEAFARSVLQLSRDEYMSGKGYNSADAVPDHLCRVATVFFSLFFIPGDFVGKSECPLSFFVVSCATSPFSNWIKVGAFIRVE